MFFTDLFNKKCIHSHVTPDKECAYCPDCGKLIKNEWYITRCVCCGVKLKSMTKNGKVVPQLHYCSNCGGSEFKVEKLDSINFIDIKFAVLQKTEIKESANCSTIRCWQEKNDPKPKLLVSYLS